MLTTPHPQGLRTRRKTISLGRVSRPTLGTGLTMGLGLGLVATMAMPARAAGPDLPVPSTAPAPAAEVILDVDAKAVLDWSLPARWTGSWDSYYQPTSEYDEEFVNPRNWGMDLDGCASTAVRAIKTYSFAVAQVGTTWKHTYNSSSCRLQLRNALPDTGAYTVSLTLHTDWGTADGVSAPRTVNAAVRDYLIVSMGDSLASGEGNPDQKGSYEWSLGKSLNIIDRVTHRPVVWRDARCHRSMKSAPSLAAKAFEDADPKTSVTFVSLACSGAELKHVIDTPYKGIAPDGNDAPAQVEAAATLFGTDARNGPRRVDALTVSAGLNDLHFSDIVIACATNLNALNNNEDCVTDGGIADQLNSLPLQYANLAGAIHTQLPDTREVYLTDYPVEVFEGGGCGLLGAPGAGIDPVEESEMNIYGARLNRTIEDAVRYLDGPGFNWNFVNRLTLGFLPHAYCSSTPWFTTLEQSLTAQGDVDGTAHPNASGHLQFSKMLRQDIVPDQASTRYRRLTVTIDAVKAAASGGADLTVNAKMWKFQNDSIGEIHSFPVPRNAQWTTVPATKRTFILDVFRAPSSPRHAIRLDLNLNGILPIQHTLSDAYGAGTHTITHPTGSLAVKYTVVVSP